MQKTLASASSAQTPVSAERSNTGNVAGFASAASVQPELRLMVTILEDAVGCYRRFIDASDEEGREQFREAEDWLFSDEQDWIFSYRSICEFVGLNPDAVRRGLLRWKRDFLADPARRKHSPKLRGRKGGRRAAAEPLRCSLDAPKDAIP